MVSILFYIHVVSYVNQRRRINLKTKKFKEGDNFYIESESLIKTKFQWRKVESIEYYRVLAVFRKYYKKWVVHTESNKIMWGKYSNKFNILASFMHNYGSEFKEVEL